jgi:hypothetical protein
MLKNDFWLFLKKFNFSLVYIRPFKARYHKNNDAPVNAIYAKIQIIFMFHNNLINIFYI